MSLRDQIPSFGTRPVARCQQVWVLYQSILQIPHCPWFSSTATSSVSTASPILGLRLLRSSPAIHQAAFDAAHVGWDYAAFDVAAGRGADAVEAIEGPEAATE